MGKGRGKKEEKEKGRGERNWRRNNIGSSFPWFKEKRHRYSWREHIRDAWTH